MLKNDYLVAKIGVDTAENELFQAVSKSRHVDLLERIRKFIHFSSNIRPPRSQAEPGEGAHAHREGTPRASDLLRAGEHAFCRPEVFLGCINAAFYN